MVVSPFSFYSLKKKDSIEPQEQLTAPERQHRSLSNELVI
jgi:hypothetical protein